jgi:hypothetical protein
MRSKSTTCSKKTLVLLLRAEAHHRLHDRAVVPAAIEEDDLARTRQLAHVAFEVPLADLLVRRLGKRNHPSMTRHHVLSKAKDRPALAGRVAPFEEDRQPLALGYELLLQLEQLDLQSAQLD